MDNNKQNLDTRLIAAAESVLEEFCQGERQWDDYEYSFAFSKGYPGSTFVSHLDEIINDEAEALEFLSGVINIEADPEKTKRILAKQELPPSEILKEWLWEIDAQDYCHVSTIVFVPLELEEIEAGWAIILQSGPSQNSEFWLVGVFGSKEKMTAYFEDNFET